MDVEAVEYFDARIFLTKLYERNLSKRTVAKEDIVSYVLFINF